MSKIRKSSYIIKNIISIAIIITIFISLYKTYKKYYFNGFTKAEYIAGITTFTRDNEEKYSDDYSYKLTSSDFNDAIFYKEIQVEANTVYKVTCMVKTQSIETEDKVSTAGAQISIAGSTETSNALIGTNGWQQLELIFNSKNRETVEIGFRLGGNQDVCKGTAWFSNFKLEKGTTSTDTNWNFACFIIENTDINLPDKGKIQLSMDTSQIDTIKTNMSRFQASCNELSNNKMTVTYDIYEIDDPLTSITYSDEFGYYVDPKDTKDLITTYLQKEEYDHIFVVIKLGDLQNNISIEVNDWIGLGGMDLYGIGFSNIRLPNDENSYIYTYEPNINTFPEEVFIHEFLHSLERTLIEYGYDIPALHDNSIYGYTQGNLNGLEQWYRDYMRCNIKDSTGNYIGLDEIVYKLKPPKESNFKYAIEISFNKEPQNVIEEIRQLFKVIKETVIKIGDKKA